MSNPLVIWLPEDLDDAWAYYKSADVQGWAADADERSDLSKLDNGGCVVVCPGTWFRVFPHSLPEMKSTERLSAAGFSIEEKLAAPIDEQHIVLGTGDDQRVGVVSQDVMETLMARLDAHGIVPSQLLAEYEAFPSDQETQTSWHRSIHPGPMGYSLDSETMQFEGALNYAKEGYARRRASGFGTRHLMAMAASLAFAFVAWLGWQWADARAMTAQADEIRAEAAQLYADATGLPAPPNFRRSIERKIKEGGETSSDFVTLTAMFFEGLKGADQVYVDSLRYNETRGALLVKMIYPGFESANQVETAFQGMPVTFKPGAVRDQKGQLVGEAEISMGPSR